MSTTDARNWLSSYQSLKRELGTDVPMQLVHVKWADGQWGVVGIADRELLVDAVLTAAADRPGVKLAAIGHLSDSLIRWSQDPAVIASLNRRGELERARDAGDLEIQDVLLCSVLDADGALTMAMGPYAVMDDGAIKFRPIRIEHLEPDTELVGPTPDLLREAMAAVNG